MTPDKLQRWRAEAARIHDLTYALLSDVVGTHEWPRVMTIVERVAESSVAALEAMQEVEREIARLGVAS